MVRGSRPLAALGLRIRRRSARYRRNHGPVRRLHPESLQLHHGDSRASLVPGSKAKARHTRFFAEHLGDTLAEGARPLAVDDAERFEISANCCVDGMHNDVIDLSNAHAAQVDFARHLDFRKIAPDGYRNFWSRRFGPGWAQ